MSQRPRTVVRTRSTRRVETGWLDFGTLERKTSRASDSDPAPISSSNQNWDRTATRRPATVDQPSGVHRPTRVDGALHAGTRGDRPRLRLAQFHENRQAVSFRCAVAERVHGRVFKLALSNALTSAAIERRVHPGPFRISDIFCEVSSTESTVPLTGGAAITE